MKSGHGVCTMANRLTKISSRFEASPVDDELLLIDVDSGHFFAMKDVALRIWTLLDSESDLDRIADALCTEYEVEQAHARTSVHAFAKSLVEAGFARFD